MRSPRKLAALVALSGLLLACSPPTSEPVASEPAESASSAVNTPLDTPLPATPVALGCEQGQALLDTLPLRDKLAQLLMVGVTGADDARAVVTDYHVGGVFFGSWTDQSMLGDPIRQIADESTSPLALSVSVDEEGGRVSRLSNLIGEQASPRALVDSGVSAEEVRMIAHDRASQMRGLGITIDFAPVVDVSDQADDTVIGDRSFSADPAEVTEYAGAYAQGLRDGGLVPVLKHFPGHGSATGDSHVGGVSTPPLSAMVERDLVPYRTLVTQPPVAVMVGHMVVPELTGDVQASLSPAAYGLLRDGVGYGGPPFGGVVFTDDLSSMQAISDVYSVPDAVLMALQAGADVALWVTTSEVPAVLDRLEAAVNAGELPLDQVNAKLLRWATLKGQHARCGS